MVVVNNQDGPSQGRRKNKRKKKKGRKRKRRGRNSIFRGPSMSQVSSFLAARMDPFHPAAIGAKIPDSFSFPTATALFKTSVGLATPQGSYTTGGFLTCNPQLVMASMTPASVTAGGTATWTGASASAAQGYSTLATYASMYRTVGWGVRLTCPLGLTTASGNTWICHVPQNFDTDKYGYTYFPGTLSIIESNMYSKSYSTVQLSERPVCITGRMTDEGCTRFRAVTGPINAAPYAENDSGHCSINILVNAAPTSSNILTAEIWHHIEYIPNDAATFIVDTNVCPLDYSQMEAASKISAAIPVADVEDEGWYESIDRTLDRVLVTAAKTVGIFNKAQKGYEMAKMAIGSLSGSRMGARGSPGISGLLKY